MNAYYMRNRGGNMVLSSLHASKAEDLGEEAGFTVFASSALSPEDEDDVYRSLLSDARIVLIRWIREKRYIPRLFASAFLFILAYFFLSVVIPDPIPIIDEIVLSFLAAALLWIALTRLDEKSALMKERNKAVAEAIMSASFLVSGDMKIIEAYYDSLYSFSLLETAEMIANGDCCLPSSLTEGWKDDFTFSLLLHLKASDSGIEKTLRRIENERDKERTARFLVHQVTVGSLDILDLALYIALKNS